MRVLERFFFKILNKHLGGFCGICNINVWAILINIIIGAPLSAVLSGSTEMRLIVSISVGPFTAMITIYLE